MALRRVGPVLLDAPCRERARIARRGTPQHDPHRRVRFYWAHADNGEVVLAVPTREVPRASDLLGMDAKAFYSPLQAVDPGPLETRRSAAHYLGAWAFVHMLLDGGEPYTPRFQGFLGKVSAGATLAKAWADAFSGIPKEQLDRDFRDYLDRRRLAVWERRLETSPDFGASTSRPLRDSEVHTLWARLVRFKGRYDATAHDDLAAARAESPGEAEPHFWLGLYALAQDDLGGAETELREAIRTDPKEPRYRLAMLKLSAVAFEAVTNPGWSMPTTVSPRWLRARPSSMPWRRSTGYSGGPLMDSTSRHVRLRLRQSTRWCSTITQRFSRRRARSKKQR